VNGTEASATPPVLPQERAETVTLPESAAKNPAPGGRQQGIGRELRKAAGNLATESAMVAIARGHPHDVPGLFTFLGARFPHQDPHLLKDRASFGQHAHGIGSLTPIGPMAPCRLHPQAAQIPQKEGHGEIGVPDSTAKATKGAVSFVPPQWLCRVRGHGPVETSSFSFGLKSRAVPTFSPHGSSTR